jgi:hypothetical protein
MHHRNMVNNFKEFKMALKKSFVKSIFVFGCMIGIPSFFLSYHIATGHEHPIAVKFDQLLGGSQVGEVSNTCFVSNGSKDCK